MQLRPACLLDAGPKSLCEAAIDCGFYLGDLPKVARFSSIRNWSWDRGICLSIGLLILFASHGCDSSNRQSVHDANTLQNRQFLRRGIGGEPASLDPGDAVDTFSFELLDDLYEGLTAESSDGAIVPGVATSWSVNESGKQYRFELRHDARWSNGDRVRAGDFVTAWRRVLDPKRGSPVADILRPIAGAAAIIAGRAPPNSLGVSAERDDLLVVNLEQPAPYLPQLLTHSATFPVYSEAAAKSHAPHTWVSNGPYVLSRWTTGAGLSLTRNPSYWDLGRVRIANVDYIPVSDDNAELRQYRAGQLDITESVPPAALASIRMERPNELYVAPFLGTAYYALNLQVGQFRKNLNLRKSLAMAIDRKVLLSTILPFGQRPAYGFVPIGTWNYDPQSWEWKDLTDSERVAEARRLYSLAGYSFSTPLRFRLLINSNASIRQVAIAIASMWKQTLGIETELIDEEYRVFLQSRKDSSRWDVARLGWIADYNDAANFLDIFRSRSPNNNARYASEEFEDLVDRAAASADPLYRRSLLEAAEKLMLSDYPIIPIYFYSAKRLIKPYVKGAQTNALNRLYSKHLTIDAH
jgi:oligopeptide transport system substrate-binding protein